MQQTTRQRVAEVLKYAVNGLTPTDIVQKIDTEELTQGDVLEHIEHIKQTEDVLAIPPECNDCNFNQFHDLTNIPSQCPNCRSDWIEEPLFTIDE